MKLIFLDFDGVIVPMSWAWGEEYKRQRATLNDDYEAIMTLKVCPDAVAQLQRIVDATGAYVVISSAWRSHRRGRTNRTWLAGLLQKRGLRNARRRIVGITPEHVHKTDGGIYVSCTRWDEIKAYLDEHPTDSFVILDDEAMPDAPTGHFVQTNYMAGLTVVEADRAIKILGRIDHAK
jgi:hypothetical protein